MTWRVEQGDCLERLKEMPDCSVDAIVTDPPAGISFMGADWDKDKGGRDQWIAWLSEVMTECLRVTKPGGHAFVWSLPRTSHWAATAIEDAGWEIRDIVTHLFGTGFPKSLDVSAAIDKTLGAEREVVGTYTARGFSDVSPTDDGRNQWAAGDVADKVGLRTVPTTEGAKKFTGYGTAMKPSAEFWILCRHPLSESTVAKNVLRWGTGGINIDGCRVELAETEDVDKLNARSGGKRGFSSTYVAGENDGDLPPGCDLSKGRWPPNTVFSHVPPNENGEGGCHKIGVKKVRGQKGYANGPGGNSHVLEYANSGHSESFRTTPILGYADPDGLETVEEYDCVEGCPIRLLNEQGVVGRGHKNEESDGREHAHNKVYGEGKGWGRHDPDNTHEDAGGPSRFFPNFSWEEEEIVPFRYISKASRRERDAGCDALEEKEVFMAGHGHSEGDDVTARFRTKARNIHSTVKPIKLMSWLCKLICPPGGTILDPFCGSGTTGCAAVLEGFNFIGIERDTTEGYLEIAKARIAYWESHTPDAKATPKPDAKEAPKPELQASLFDLDCAENA